VSLPPWISEAEANVYVEQFSKSGYRGGLSRYPNIARNRELLLAFRGMKIKVSAFYAAGDRDLVLAFQGMDSVTATLPEHVPLLQRTLVFPGCGHWTQLERPNEVNAALFEFLKPIP
jgi:pimeloyl-ACP methyl ester carboxylesterase